MYNYEDKKESLFTDEGQRVFLKVRDTVNKHLQQSGAVRLQEAISTTSGDSWRRIACLDRMVELGEVREVTSLNTASQYRIFTYK